MSRKGRRLKKRNTSKKGINILKLLQYFFIVLMIVSAIVIYKWWKDNMNNSKLLDNISQYVVKDNDKGYSINFNELKRINNETVGWIKVNGIDIEYPVVKHSDNEYYLNHSFDNSYNRAGWIFVDCSNKLDGTDKNIVIYGHNRRDGSMFARLNNILKEDWYNNENNKYVYFITDKEHIIYEVFSIYKIENEDYYIKTEFNSNEQFNEFINTIKARSVKDFNVDVTNKDKLLTLSTCADNNNYRVVLHAKRK